MRMCELLIYPRDESCSYLKMNGRPQLALPLRVVNLLEGCYPWMGEKCEFVVFYLEKDVSL